MGFLVMFGEVCHCLNRWMASMSQKIECKENYDMDVMKECSTFLNDGLNRAVLASSGIKFYFCVLVNEDNGKCPHLNVK
jgi:hypothetical protein